MIYQSKPCLEVDDFSYISEILQTGQVARGKLVNRLESRFALIQNSAYALATSSGTAALHLALLVLGAKSGREIIIPSYTCTSLLNAVRYVDAVPVLADIDPDTLNVNVETVKRKLSPRTSAIVLTHTFGYPSAMKDFSELGIPIVEDCAHALGAKHDGQPVGGTGAIAVFSLYATKMIAAGEGGLICTSSSSLAEAVADYNDPDKRDDYRVRYNYKMSDLTAGLALSQLNKLFFFVQRRTEIARRYRDAFARFPGVVFQRVIPGSSPSYYRFVILIPKADAFIKFTQERGVMCDRPIYRPLHKYLEQDTDDMPGTDAVWETAVSIPLYPSLSDGEIEDIITTVSDGLERHVI